MRVLISGGAGFIGSSLALALRDRGHEVTVLDNLSGQVHGDDPQQSPLFRAIDGQVRFVRGDVRRREDWEQALPGQDAVVHLAAETGTGQSMYQVERYVDVNVRGTAVLLDLLANRRHRVDKVVVASSRAIYGEGRYRGAAGTVFPGPRREEDLRAGRFECRCPVGGGPLQVQATDEDSRIHPSSVYGITKYDQEQLVLAVGAASGFRPLAFRYQNVYGPGQSLRNPYTGILSIFSNLLRQDQDVDIFEDGLESRDFVHIDDVVEATIRGIEHEDASGVFNVGSGVATTVAEVAEHLRHGYGSSSRVAVSGRFRLGDIRHNYADLTRIRDVLGFAPRVPFAQGIAGFIRWVKSQPVMESGYRASLDEMQQRGLLK